MIKYRPEIDGLRAVAVLSVLFFHAGFSVVPGGFVGVDVFFVISGFLITSIITNEVKSGGFTYSRFYERRIRRLLPPLIPVLLSSLLAAFFLLDTPQFNEFVYSLYASVGFLANWFFLASVDYFGGPGELTPLLHIWSLSIEEQFYFVFPALLILVLKKRESAALPIFLALAIASLLYSTLLLYQDARADAFYNSPARFWELLVGAMLAVYGKPQQLSGKKADIFEITGATLIAISIVFYTKESYFPGAAALLPVLGTALIIYGGGQGRFVSPILKSRLFVAVGLISYSLYLWHWPILVFIKIISPGASASLMLFGLLLSFVMATLSYYLVEGPIRRKRVIRTRPATYAFATVAMGLAVCVAAVSNSDNVSGLRIDGFAKTRVLLFSGERAELISVIERERKYYLENLNVNYTGDQPGYDSIEFSGWTCSYDKGNTPERIFDCLKAQAVEGSVLVLGDSIARDTMHSLRRGYPETNFVALHQSSCPPAAVGNCFPESRELLARVGKELSFKAVVINYRYRPQDWMNVESGIDQAKLVSSNVLILGVSPLFSMPADNYLKMIPAEDGIPVFISEKNERLAKWSYTELAEQARKMAEKHGATFVSLVEFFCPGGQCRIWIDNRPGDPLFIDEQHLTTRGMDEFGEFLSAQEELRKVL